MTVVRLTNDDGTRIALHLAGVSVIGGGVRVEFDLAAETYRAVSDRTWFHLTPLTRGPGAAGFAPADDVRIEAQLDPRLAPGVVAIAPSADAVEQLLVSADPSSPLIATDSWYARSVTCVVDVGAGTFDDVDDDPIDAVLREGYRTAWGTGRREEAALPLVAVLGEHLERRGWNVSPVADRPGFRWRTTGRGGAWNCLALVDDEADWCVIYSLLDGRVDDDRRPAVAEQLAALNAGLLFGTWELSAAPGSIRFRSSLELTDRAGAAALLERLVERNLDTVEEHLEALIPLAEVR